MVFGLIEGSEHPVAVHVQLAPVPADQVIEVPDPRPIPHPNAVRAGGRDTSGFLTTLCDTHLHTLRVRADR